MLFPNCKGICEYNFKCFFEQLGLTDTKKEKTFVWGSDQAEVTYSNWYGREPNNAGNEDCVHIRPKKLSQWNDSKCGQKRSSQGPNTALCQKF